MAGHFEKSHLKNKYSREHQYIHVDYIEPIEPGLLGLSPSSWSGATANRNVKSIPLRYIPFAGWRASPALGAMQEPIPDFRFAKYINKTMLSITVNLFHSQTSSTSESSVT